ncbi:MAG: hypothetical protein OEW15_15920 [Nitrospirota bacterium]|nr:hypothetical protein [Nitrospirota bacterium]
MYLHSWDRFAKVYDFNVDDGQCRVVREKDGESSTSTGFVKSFLFGKKVAFYVINDAWWIQYKKLRFNINDKRLQIQIKYNGLITILRIHFEKEKSVFIDTNLILFISRELDPTHDSWDEEGLNFIGQLAEMRKTDNNKES